MNKPQIIALISIVTLAACGGGGSGNKNTTTPSSNMTITSANATEASRVSYESAQMNASLGTLSSETGLTASTPGGFSKLGSGMSAAANSNVSSAQVPIPPTVSACAGGGTLTISGDIADIITFNLTQGDFFLIDFDMCSDGAGSTIDGVLDYVVDAFSGNFLGGLYDLTMTMSIENFQLATPEDVVTMNGVATARLDTLLTPAVAAEVSGPSITVDTNNSTETLTNFASSQTLDAGVSPSPYTMTASGTLDSSQLNGTVQYSTPTPFSGFDNDYPDTGVMLIMGEASSARLTAVDNVNVMIEIDTNGDGSYDEIINTTWAELTATP